MASNEKGSIFNKILRGYVKRYYTIGGFGFILPEDPEVRQAVLQIRFYEKRKDKDPAPEDIFFTAVHAEKLTFIQADPRNTAGQLNAIPVDTLVTFRIERRQKQGNRLLHAVDVRCVSSESD